MLSFYLYSGRGGQLYSKISAALIVTSILAYSSEVVAAPALYDTVDLYAEPSSQSSIIGKGSAGPVAVIQRRGYWVQINSSEGMSGWVMLDHVQMDETTQWMAPIDPLRDTGRLGAGR